MRRSRPQSLQLSLQERDLLLGGSKSVLRARLLMENGGVNLLLEFGNGFVVTSNEIEICIERVLEEVGVGVERGRRKREMKLRSQNKPMNESENGRPLMRSSGGFENGNVEFVRVIKEFEKWWKIFDFVNVEIEESNKEDKGLVDLFSGRRGRWFERDVEIVRGEE